jgi:ElaB/YqjD/DUF883 family membrane-anchored ribosome-binding protein
LETTAILLGSISTTSSTFEENIMNTFNFTKTALLVTACSLASFSFAQTAPAADTGANSTTSAQTLTTTMQVKPESGLLNTSVQSQRDLNSQLGISDSKSVAPAPATNASGELGKIGATSATATTNQSASAAAVSTSQSISTATQLTQSVAGKFEQNVNSLNNIVASNADRLMATGEDQIKSQADFAKATTDSLNAQAQSTLSATTNSLRDVQSATPLAVNDAVKSGVNDTVASTTNALLSQEISNQVNTTVTQEIGKTVQSSVANSINTSITQNLGL